MLNRRYLRIKVMQALYGFEQSRQANYQVALDNIEQAFVPDWDEKPTADYDLIKRQTLLATELFSLNFESSSGITDTRIAPKVRQIVVRAIETYQNQVDKDRYFFSQNLLREAETIYANYLLLLTLPIALAEIVAEDRTQLAQSFLKKNEVTGDFKFINNAVVGVLRNHPLLQQALSRHGVRWENYTEVLRDFYRSLVKPDVTYQAYNHLNGADFEREKEVVNYIFKALVFSQHNLNFFEVSEMTFDRFQLEKALKWNGLAEMQRKVLDSLEETIQSFAQSAELSVPNTAQLVASLQAELRTLAQQITKGLVQPKEDPTKKITESKAENNKIYSEFKQFNEFLKHTCTQLVQVFSALLAQAEVNLLDNQKKNLDAIQTALFAFLEAMELAKNPQEQITVQIKSAHSISMLNDLFMELDHNWAENDKVVQSMVQKTLKAIESADKLDFELMELSPNWEDDKVFYQDLFKLTLDNEKEYETVISQKSQNWDISRVATIDKIILKMAIAEMIYYYSIPVKVSINEYIELAKGYSTPKSKQFINGMLDKISAELVNSGKIKKSGRGLLDTK
jgi:N utilization substance protein B